MVTAVTLLKNTQARVCTSFNNFVYVAFNLATFKHIQFNMKRVYNCNYVNFELLTMPNGFPMNQSMDVQCINWCRIHFYSSGLQQRQYVLATFTIYIRWLHPKTTKLMYSAVVDADWVFVIPSRNCRDSKIGDCISICHSHDSVDYIAKYWDTLYNLLIIMTSAKMH